MNSRKAMLLAILSLLFLNNQPILHGQTGDVVRKISFRTAFGTSAHVQAITISQQMLSYWKSAPHPPAAEEYSDDSYVLDFSHYVDVNAVSKFAVSVAEVAQLGEEDVADTMLSFVQNVGYVANGYTTTNTLYPSETLASGGVCDDLSALYASMMIAVGFRVVFIWYPKEADLGGSKVTHVNVGVRLTNPPQHATGQQYASFTVKDTDYYVAETTREGWRVGDQPGPLQGQRAYAEEAPAPTSTLVETEASTTIARTAIVTVTSTRTLSSFGSGWTSVQSLILPVILVLVAGIAGYGVGRRRASRTEFVSPATNVSERHCRNCGSDIPYALQYCPQCGKADYSQAFT